MKKQPDDMKGVRFMVFAMGIVLMAGVLVLVYAGYDKIQHQKKHPKGVSAVEVRDCVSGDVSVALPAGEVQLPITRAGDEITITIEGAQHQKLAVLDACSGKILRVLLLE